MACGSSNRTDGIDVSEHANESEIGKEMNTGKCSNGKDDRVSSRALVHRTSAEGRKDDGRVE